MTWTRAPLAAALVVALRDGGLTCALFSCPPMSGLNAPAVVVGRPVEVLYSVQSFAVDRVTIPIVCIGALEHDDDVADLVAQARKAIEAEPTLGGTVQTVEATSERNYRQVKVAGADLLLAADLVLEVSM
jgi:hypothetical protein